MNLKDAMESAGVRYDYDKVLQRFMNNEGLLIKFTKKFAGDPSFQQLIKNQEDCDYQSMEISAHTLKGVSANLGFEELSESSKDILDLVRKTNLEPEQEKVDMLVEKLLSDYEKVIKGINSVD